MQTQIFGWLPKCLIIYCSHKENSFLRGMMVCGSDRSLLSSLCILIRLFLFESLLPERAHRVHVLLQLQCCIVNYLSQRMRKQLQLYPIISYTFTSITTRRPSLSGRLLSPGQLFPYSFIYLFLDPIISYVINLGGSEIYLEDSSNPNLASHFF